MSFDEEKLRKQFAAEKGKDSPRSDSGNSSLNQQAPDDDRTSHTAQATGKNKPKVVQVNHTAEWWTVEEACAVGGFKSTSFYELRKTHDLPSYRPKGFGRRMVKRVEFLQWLEQDLWGGGRDAQRDG